MTSSTNSRPVINSITDAEIDVFAKFGRAAMLRETALTPRAPEMIRQLEQARGIGATVDGKPVALLILYYDENAPRTEAGSLIVDDDYRRKDLASVLASLALVWTYWLNRELVVAIDQDNVSMKYVVSKFGAYALEPSLDSGSCVAPSVLEFIADYPDAAIKAARILIDPKVHQAFEIRHRVWTQFHEELKKLAATPLSK